MSVQYSTALGCPFPLSRRTAECAQCFDVFRKVVCPFVITNRFMYRYTRFYGGRFVTTDVRKSDVRISGTCCTCSKHIVITAATWIILLLLAEHQNYYLSMFIVCHYWPIFENKQRKECVSVHIHSYNFRVNLTIIISYLPYLSLLSHF